jgi:pSer/pThr/pTyr-binding forkhead associated (FHA) protein
MADTFKVPLLPSEEPKAEATPTSSTTESTHSPFLKPELPPTNILPTVRHKHLQYNIPETSAIPPAEFTLEVLRDGSIIDYISLSNRPYTVFGRSPDSDIVLEHPTVSRYHAIVQYKSEFEHGQPPGLYLYDCGSTHGTFMNKKRLEPRVYVRMKIGYIIKFGQSIRLYIVQGDSSAEADQVNNSTGDDVTHEQMKQFHAKRAKMLAAVRAKRENEANEASNNSNTEIDWGMGSEIDESAIAAAAAAAASEAEAAAREEEILRIDNENKKRAAAADLQNRIEYQKAKNDKAVLQEIMTRVSETINFTPEKESLFVLSRLMNHQQTMKVVRKKNHSI